MDINYSKKVFRTKILVPAIKKNIDIMFSSLLAENADYIYEKLDFQQLPDYEQLKYKYTLATEFWALILRDKWRTIGTTKDEAKIKMLGLLLDKHCYYPLT